MITCIIGYIKSIFLFLESFFGENYVWYPGFLSGAESFSLDMPGKTNPQITSTCLTIWEEVDGTLSLRTQCQNVYIFWWNIWCIMVYQSTSSSEY